MRDTARKREREREGRENRGRKREKGERMGRKREEQSSLSLLSTPTHPPPPIYSNPQMFSSKDIENRLYLLIFS